MALNRARRIFVPTNPDLADILGRTDLIFDIYFCFLDPRFLDFRSPDLQILDFQISGSPNSQISKFSDFQVPRFPDAAAGAAG